MNNEKIKIELTELEALKMIKALAIARMVDEDNFETYFDISEKAITRMAAMHEYSEASRRAYDGARNRGWQRGSDAFDAMEEKRIRELFDAA